MSLPGDTEQVTHVLLQLVGYAEASQCMALPLCSTVMLFRIQKDLTWVQEYSPCIHTVYMHMPDVIHI